MEVLALEFVCMFEIKCHFLNETCLPKFVWVQSFQQVFSVLGKVVLLGRF